MLGVLMLRPPHFTQRCVEEDKFVAELGLVMLLFLALRRG